MRRMKCRWNNQVSSTNNIANCAKNPMHKILLRNDFVKWKTLLNRNSLWISVFIGQRKQCRWTNLLFTWSQIQQFMLIPVLFFGLKRDPSLANKRNPHCINAHIFAVPDTHTFQQCPLLGSVRLGFWARPLNIIIAFNHIVCGQNCDIYRGIWHGASIYEPL